MVLKRNVFDLDAPESDGAQNKDNLVSLVSFNEKNKIIMENDFRVAAGQNYELCLFE